ncbi:hypothetical protein I79_018240 [Cricetulus griseus]|uniref:Secreted protein n=1 Tax=Cricetulus griseus TaxID=10029 RepID=G3I464_CRIGR|nr:hypothetical protein I79_018240 [Cricetulus griseus]
MGWFPHLCMCVSVCPCPILFLVPIRSALRTTQPLHPTAHCHFLGQGVRGYSSRLCNRLRYLCDLGGVSRSLPGPPGPHRTRLKPPWQPQFFSQCGYTPLDLLM